ncbi:MAG: sulfotransferase family 2 domain-containing protein, partial [Cypionkella sp.]
MIISRGRRYVFVHIPKTGGTALTLALEARAMKDDLIIGDTPKARARKARLKAANAAGRLWKHSTLADIDGLIPRDELAGFFCFTLVRNPWDRLVSYYHWLADQTFDHPAV